MSARDPLIPLDKDYWREPTYVFTGFCWLCVGVVIGWVTG